MKIITIIGLGLIGSSIARAVKKSGKAIKIHGYNKSQSSIDKALELRIIDEGFNDLEKSVCGSDLVIICTPIGTYADIAKEISVNLGNGALTDVGSVKQATVDLVLQNLPENLWGNFVPAHPIAGSEKTGVDAGFAELFEDKRLIITPTEFSKKFYIEKTAEIWKICKAAIEIMDTKKHDEIYAYNSHLIHFLAFCYAHFLKENDLSLGGGGERFKAFIRVARSSSGMWRDIFLYNKQPVLNAVDDFIESILGGSFDVENENLSKNAYVLLPDLVADVLLKIVPDQEYSGTAFAGMVGAKIDENSSVSKNLLNEFIKQIDLLKSYIELNSGQDIEDYINKIS